jgi:hypothetical protein
MLLLVTKYAITSLLVVLVSEVAKRSDRLGALIGALPLVTLLVMIWLYLENQRIDKVAEYALFTFWYVLPSLPLFLLTPALLSRGVNFWLSLVAGVIVAAASFPAVAVVAKQFGVRLLP